MVESGKRKIYLVLEITCLSGMRGIKVSEDRWGTRKDLIEEDFDDTIGTFGWESWPGDVIEIDGKKYLQKTARYELEEEECD